MSAMGLETEAIPPTLAVLGVSVLRLGDRLKAGLQREDL